MTNHPNDTGHLQSTNEDDKSMEKLDIGKSPRNREPAQTDYDDPHCKGPSRTDITLLSRILLFHRSLDINRNWNKFKIIILGF